MEQRILDFIKHLLIVLGLFGVCLIGFWGASFLINDEIDRKILLFFNPDAYVPILDELMVTITDFSTAVFGVLFVSWEFGYLAYTHNKEKLPKIQKIQRILGLVLGIGVISAYWWASYELKIIFLPLGFIISLTYWWISTTYSNFDEKYLILLNQIVWLTVIASLLSISGEAIIKNIVQRPRPLNSINNSWNSAIMTRPDEIVKGGYSYYSGHSSGLFAALTPLMWTVKKRSTKLFLFVWAAVHAFSRIYLAAHFPFCVLMGSLAGFLWGTIVFKVFKPK